MAFTKEEVNLIQRAVQVLNEEDESNYNRIDSLGLSDSKDKQTRRDLNALVEKCKDINNFVIE